jgi:hypothetical protein
MFYMAPAASQAVPYQPFSAGLHLLLVNRQQEFTEQQPQLQPGPTLQIISTLCLVLSLVLHLSSCLYRLLSASFVHPCSSGRRVVSQLLSLQHNRQ